MEATVKERTVTRRQFTRTGNELDAIMNTYSTEFDNELISLITSYKKVKEIAEKLMVLDIKIKNYILNAETWDEAILERELEESEKYRSKWISLETRYEMLDRVNPSIDITHTKPKDTTSIQTQRHFKLPILEFKKFDGNLKNWLPFWGQFKKIHEDSNIDDDDKLQYLQQSMQSGTEVNEFINSLSACPYKDCLEQLKSRYARDDLLIQVYVRELLQMVLLKDKETVDLITLYDRLNTHLRALETLGVAKDKYSAFILPMVESALPEDILRAWERSRIEVKVNITDDDLNNLLFFLKREVESEQRITMAKSTFTKSDKAECVQFPIEPSAGCLIAGTKNFETKLKSCLWCDKNTHTSLECYTIHKMTLEQRREHLKKKKACGICLKIGHHPKVCKAFVKCYVCGRRHSPTMCPGKLMSKDDSLATVSTQCAQAHGVTLLQTLMVNIVCGEKKITVRALIDNGSQRSYIRQDVAVSMNIPAVGMETLGHSLFGGVEVSSRQHNVYKVNIENVNKSFNFDIIALGQICICKNIPRFNYSDHYLKTLLLQHNIDLTDKGENMPEVALLIGADFSGLLMTSAIIHLENGLVAIKTKLGWTLQGKQVGVTVDNLATTTLFCTNNLTGFWSLEILGIKDPAETKSKAQAEAEAVMSFEENIKVDSENRYEVSLPWKVGHDDLLSNRMLAERRLETTTKRLLSTGKFFDYNKVFNDWCDSGIIEIVPVPEEDVNTHYLPHRAVVKESSLTTKLRPVFDASACDRNGKSLNSCLNKGINFLDHIPNLLVGFRKGAIGITSDIAKAFLCISVAPKDRDYLRFLWWADNERTKIMTYRHCRVVFGLTSSPFLLSATISYHLNHITDKYKDTAILLKKSFYVDNCILSLDSDNEVRKFISESKEIMYEARFDLRQWVTSPLQINETGKDVVLVLGLLWDTVSDELSCNLSNLPSYLNLGNITKRDLMSLTQRIFDPIGFTCPATLTPRLLLQEAWRRDLSWDDNLPEDLTSDFKKWYEHIACLNDCKIPRRLTTDLIKECKCSLHMFCDASKIAYGACVFLRAEKDGKVTVQLLSAKARVAPPGKMTIPRLELTAALIGSRLLAEAKKNLEIQQCVEFCWTDSCVALCWIKRELPWNTYIGNRVKEIRDNSKPNNWCHISGSLNWADLTSRGCNARQLLTSRWWEGPTWLFLDPEEWPRSSLDVDEKQACLELKKSICNTNICIYKGLLNSFTYFSKYTKIVRMFAWVQRFIYNTRHKEGKCKGELTCDEYEEAEINLIKMIQAENRDSILKRSVNLSTYYDNKGLLRINTKLLLSDLQYNIRVPVLLSAENVIVRRLVEQRHRKLQHAGTNQLMTDIRTRYWIIGIRRLVKSVIAGCTICNRYRSKPVQVTSAPLPVDRINCFAPFEITGVDLAGPLFLRNGNKCWIVLYTCAVYRAVHLEVTKSLSTEAFMLTLRRFIARRGRVKQIISDNGTNFVGAKNLLSIVNWEEVQKLSIIDRIKWKMNAPTASWWGGFWECLIRIMKDLLRRILGKSRVSYEELETILCECEAIMNGRPLTYVQDDKNICLEPLTPANFIQCISQTDTTDLDQIDATKLNQRLKYLQNLREDFKTRFKSEYLTALVSRGKEIKVELKVGDVVLIETEDKRVKWPLGLIVAIYPGKDSVSRTAQVKTSSGCKIRPFQRLYRLEVSAAEKEELFRINKGLESEGKDINIKLKEKTLDEVSTEGERTTKYGRVIRMPILFVRAKEYTYIGQNRLFQGIIFEHF